MPSTRIILFLTWFATISVSAQSPVPPHSRINCFPEQNGSDQFKFNVTQPKCESRGCTFDSDTGGDPLVPPCYMHPYGIGYKVNYSCVDCFDFALFAQLVPLTDAVIFDPPVKNVHFTAQIVADSHLQVKLTDGDNDRYEVPFVLPSPDNKQINAHGDFNIEFTKIPFAFKVSRISDGTVMFDTSLGGFVFSDRFLQITTTVATPNFYGLGENVHLSLRHKFDYQTWPMFARDQSPSDPPPVEGVGFPLYGVHPIYMVLENSGSAHGVFLMNSNAMEYQLIPNTDISPAVIIRTVGGIFDFHIYSGPSPTNVIQQHTAFVGRPYMPPYWAFGFHLSRWDYNNLTHMRQAVNRTRQYGVPLDAIYADIDHLKKYRDFTYDHIHFHGLPGFFSDEKQNGLRSVIIVDPGVEIASSYRPYEELALHDTFVKWPNGSVMDGHTFPGPSDFPDFFLNTTGQVWQDLIVRHHSELPFDGVWIDLNEPSNFQTNEGAGELNCPTSYYDDPPYRTYGIAQYDFIPVGRNSSSRLSEKTLCMEARQLNGKHLHYNVHSLYGWTESFPTIKAVQATNGGTRHFVLSRSTFAGSGRMVSHWLGDNSANWDDIKRSIIGMLEMSMFGIAHTGADICGYMLNSTAILCKRWTQLGAFYPFSRNHNCWNTHDQDPGFYGPVVAEPARIYMTHRYRLLPYMYTLFYWAHVNGTTVARPLFFEFPTDQNVFDIDQEFMLGPSILVAPILYENSTSVTAYIPKGVWLDKVTDRSRPMMLCDGGQVAKFNDTTYLQRGGSVIPRQDINDGNIVATKFTRLMPFTLDVLLDCYGQASGSLFWDDGESLLENGDFLLVQYSSFKNGNNITMTGGILARPGTTVFTLPYRSIYFYGVTLPPKSLVVTCPTWPQLKAVGNFDADSQTLAVTFEGDQLQIGDSFQIVIAF